MTNRTRKKRVIPGTIEVRRGEEPLEGSTSAGPGRRSTVASITARGEEVQKDRKAAQKQKKQQMDRYLNKIRQEHHDRIEAENDPKKKAERENTNRRTVLKMKSAIRDRDIGSAMDFAQDFRPTMADMRENNRKKRKNKGD